MKILHTLEHAQNGLTVKATQQYMHNRGHHQYVITNSAGHIVRVGQTSGGPPTGKLETKDLVEMLRDAVSWLDEEDRALYGLEVKK